jgi:hypothetical protein
VQRELDGGLAAQVAAVVGVDEAAAERVLAACAQRHGLPPATVVTALLFTLKKGKPAAEVAAGFEAGGLRVSESTVLAIANCALATKWKLDEDKLHETTEKALWARRVRRELDFYPPMWRDESTDRPNGALTAGREGIIPAARERLGELASALTALAAALRRARLALGACSEEELRTLGCESLRPGVADDDAAAWLLLTRRAAEDGVPSQGLFDLTPGVVEAAALVPALTRAAEWARTAVPDGSKPRASAAAGEDGDAAALLAHLCRAQGWAVPARGRDRESPWQALATAWLRLLGVQNVGQLVREPPPLDGLMELVRVCWATGVATPFLDVEREWMARFMRPPPSSPPSPTEPEPQGE